MKELSIFVFSEMKKCEKYFGKSQQKNNIKLDNILQS